MNAKQSKKWSVPVKVIISGYPYESNFERLRPVRIFIDRALRETGNLGQPPDNWELRDMGGMFLDPGITGKDAGIVAGQTLYLNLRAGIGGNVQMDAIAVGQLATE